MTIFVLMAGIFERLGELVTGKQKREALAENVTRKIDSFLITYFPKKSKTVIHVENINSIITQFEDIKKLVQGIDYKDYAEIEHIENILTNLSAYYFEHIPKFNKDIPLIERDVSEIINGLTIIKHIVVNELERKHKDISAACESIRLQTLHILETYFHKSNGNQILYIRATDLNKDFEILKKRIDYLKEITQKVQPEYKNKLTQMNNIINALHELLSFAEKKGINYELYDKKQIIDKLNFLMEIAKV